MLTDLKQSIKNKINQQKAVKNLKSKLWKKPGDHVSKNLRYFSLQ